MLSTQVLETGLWSYDLLRTVSKRIIAKPRFQSLRRWKRAKA